MFALDQYIDSRVRQREIERANALAVQRWEKEIARRDAATNAKRNRLTKYIHALPA